MNLTRGTWLNKIQDAAGVDRRTARQLWRQGKRSISRNGLSGGDYRSLVGNSILTPIEAQNGTGRGSNFGQDSQNYIDNEIAATLR